MIEYIEKTASTNDWIREKMKQTELPDGFVIYTGFQEAGRGQASNNWESEPGKNLLSSVLIYPYQLAISDQFLVSQYVSLAILESLSLYADQISIKWPNDIYWKDKKIAGILIENTWQGPFVKFSIIGMGLNLNQAEFKSDAPNPVSLKQITGTEHSIERFLETIIEKIGYMSEEEPEQIRKRYFEHLYRSEGYHEYLCEGTKFEAMIDDVETDGRLILRLRDGSRKEFYFKEVEFCR